MALMWRLGPICWLSNPAAMHGWDVGMVRGLGVGVSAAWRNDFQAVAGTVRYGK